MALLLVVTCGVGKVNENANVGRSIGLWCTLRLFRGLVEGSSGCPLGRLWYSTVEREVQIDLEVGTGTALGAGLEWWGHDWIRVLSDFMGWG